MAFGFIVNDAVLIQSVQNGNPDRAIVALVMAFSLRYSERPGNRILSRYYFDYAHDTVLKRTWSDSATALLQNAISFCLLAQYWSVMRQTRKSMALYHLSGVAARRYLDLFQSYGSLNSASYLEDQLSLEICNCISWLTASLILMPAIALDCESEGILEYRPRLVSNYARILRRFSHPDFDRLPPPSLNPKAFAGYKLRQQTHMRIKAIDDLYIQQVTDLAELAHTADASFWILLKPVLQDGKPPRGRFPFFGTVVNNQSMRANNTIAHYTASEPMSSRLATAVFFLGVHCPHTARFNLTGVLTQARLASLCLSQERQTSKVHLFWLLCTS